MPIISNAQSVAHTQSIIHVPRIAHAQCIIHIPNVAHAQNIIHIPGIAHVQRIERRTPATRAATNHLFHAQFP